MSHNPAIDSFIQETTDLLEGLEALLLDLEQGATAQAVDAVFRALHTIKGSSAMFGFTVLSRFTHHFEEAFDAVREGRLTADPRLIGLSLAARDHMRGLLAMGGDGPEAEALAGSAEAQALVVALSALTSGGGQGEPGQGVTGQTERASAPQTAAPQTSAPQTAAPQTATPATRRFAIWFKPEPGALRNGMRPDLLLAELAALGRMEARIDASALPPLEALVPGDCYLGWKITLETTADRAAIDGVFIFADDAELEISELQSPTATAAPAPECAPEAAPATTEPATTEPNPADSAQADSPLAPPPGTNFAARRAAAAQNESVRVPAQRLDEMIDQLGELVIAFSRLDQIARRLNDPLLEAVVEEVDRLVTGLRDTTLAIRMLPIELVFGKFRRVVRDLAAELGKSVQLVTEGGETEIDKNVIDRLTEPLVHMIRNSIDHGIEPEAARRAAGKPGEAVLRLSARQDGGEVLITIEDDGRGIDHDAVRRRAVERRLIEPDAVLSEEDCLSLIFRPGFSTAATVTSVSGRGVGMDAVRSAIEGLRGSVAMASTKGQGTRVTLRLPLTLAIIDGLMVRLGDAVFAIPLSAVEECVEFDAEDRRRDSGRSLLRIRDSLVPYIDLGRMFQRPPAADSGRRVVVVMAEGMRVGLIVDDILGQAQTVIKTLSPFHRGLPGLAGATILGDGAVALILDVGGLVKHARLGDRRSFTRRATDQSHAA